MNEEQELPVEELRFSSFVAGWARNTDILTITHIPTGCEVRGPRFDREAMLRRLAGMVLPPPPRLP
jgi:hypothetical protein